MNCSVMSTTRAPSASHGAVLNEHPERIAKVAPAATTAPIRIRVFIGPPQASRVEVGWQFDLGGELGRTDRRPLNRVRSGILVRHRECNPERRCAISRTASSQKIRSPRQFSPCFVSRSAYPRTSMSQSYPSLRSALAGVWLGKSVSPMPPGP